MAKKKTAAKNFELDKKPTNPAQVQSAFDELQQFIENDIEHSQTTKNYLLTMVEGHRNKTGLKVPQNENAAHLNSAIEKINNLLNQ